MVGLVVLTIMPRIYLRDGTRTRWRSAAATIRLRPGVTTSSRSSASTICTRRLPAWIDLIVATATTSIYYILSMEFADPIQGQDDVLFWWDAGLWVVGLVYLGP